MRRKSRKEELKGQEFIKALLREYGCYISVPRKFYFK